MSLSIDSSLLLSLDKSMYIYIVVVVVTVEMWKTDLTEAV